MICPQCNKQHKQEHCEQVQSYFKSSLVGDKSNFESVPVKNECQGCGNKWYSKTKKVIPYSIIPWDMCTLCFDGDIYYE
jgi:hypothetical protein